MNKPFLYPFAKDGDRNTELPNANATDNSVSFQSGFTLPYELNPANGGKNLERKDMNEIFFRICEAINNISQEVDKWMPLTTENLNDIKEKGRYYQQLNQDATNINNYPQNLAGYLIVLNNSISSYGITQIYKIWNSDKIFIRRTINSTTWSNWDSFVLTSEFNNKITALQNTDTNLNNNKEDKTKFTNGIINATINSNLNNLTQNGFYWRKINEGNPLPTTNGGAVIVNTNNNQVIQYFYTDYWSSDNGGVWFRMRNANNIWSEWHHIENSEHAEVTYRKIADSYTKSEVDTKINSTTHRYKALRCNPSANTIQWQTGGLSISKISGSRFRITHNLGTTNYAVTASINRIGRPLGASSANVVDIQANYCEISCHWGGDNTAGDTLPTMANVSIFY